MYINNSVKDKIVACLIVLLGVAFMIFGLPVKAKADICGKFSFGGPPFLPEAVPPLVMLVMGRDHKLYYEAYNDATDLNGDGQLDIGYNPDIDYYGYFDSYKCYDYSNSNNRFEPQAVTEDKKCSTVSGSWSGDFLNYLTMSRMDTIRKVLYGGYRSTDSDSETVLERVFIPQDAHSWGKEYSADDGYNITDYTPLSQPMSGRRHLFASTTLNSANDPPLLRVLEDVGPWSGDHNMRIWNWVAIERPVAGNQLAGTKDGVGDTRRTIEQLRQEADSQGYSLTDYHVRVQVCHPDMPEDNCKLYPGETEIDADGFETVITPPVYKPIGLLQKYGEGDSMYFGLMTGSYKNNMSGGVLRKNIGSISDEIDPATGEFTGEDGIIKAIDNLRIWGFNYSDYHYKKCPGANISLCESGWPDSFVADRPMEEGEFSDWGNPIAEMMYEGLRYFADEGITADYEDGVSTCSIESELGLPLAQWEDPFIQNNQTLYCAKPIMLVISDIYPSYDSDQLPGSAFAASGWSSGKSIGTGTLHVQERLDAISGDIAGQYFIGHSDNEYDGSCSPKELDGLGEVRGLCPEEPTKQGSYYAGSVAHYGRNVDLRGDLTDEQKVSTFAVALSSPLPEIRIPVGSQVVTLVPFGKTVSTNRTSVIPDFQPTNTIVGFYVEELRTDYGRFRINFEDVEQGADHDMDAIVIYEYQINADNTITITLYQEYAAAGYVQHIGYIISGTTSDGTYLDIANIYDNPHNSGADGIGSDVDYFLDTPQGQYHPDPIIWDNGEKLPRESIRTFTPSSTPAAELLKDPLWYAAKWGGYEEGKPWDQTGDGLPDHYFYVANPLRLEQQLSRAFQLMLSRIASGSAASVLSTSRRGEGAVTQAVFWPSKSDSQGNEVSWTGDVRALKLDIFGQMRDADDEMVTYFFDDQDKRTKACVGVEMSEGSCTGGSVKELDEIKYLWTASDWLNALHNASIPTNRDVSAYKDNTGFRYIFTWTDADNDGIIDNGEVIPFDVDNVESIFSWKDLGSDAVAKEYYKKVINWIRGLDQAGMRSRQYDGDTWRLGDIIYSSPVMVGAPAENYDLIWGDPSYGRFYRKYRDRRNMVYFGANDGMLHAVNAGFYTSGVGFETKGGPPLGAEMWAYVPYNLLPHLACLTDPNYSHQYYVDLRPRVVDVKIFDSSDPRYPGGWGTILIGGMRLGGGYIAEGEREFSSSFFVLDITDPEEKPRLLGETTYKSGRRSCKSNGKDESCVNFGYTVSAPTVVPIKGDDDKVKWFLVLSTGPDNDDKKSIQSTQKAKIAVIPMEEYLGDTSNAKWSNLRIPDAAAEVSQTGRVELSANNSFISTGMVTVDYDFDYFADILFFGITTGVSGNSGGNVQHLKVERQTDPKQWRASSVFNAGKPITGEMNVGWYEDTVWLYFGSGRFWEANDKLDNEVQTIYGIMEKKKTSGPAYNFANIGMGQLEDVTGILVDPEPPYELFCETGVTCDADRYETFHGLRNKITESSNVGGWFRDLPAGERILGQPSLLGGLLNFAAYHPDPDGDICASEGESRLYSLYYLTGTSWIRNVFGKENPEQNGEEYVQFIQDLGPGMTISPSLHLGEQEGTTVYTQLSTGGVDVKEQTDLPTGETRSGRGSWHTIDIDCQPINKGQACPKP